VPLIRPRFQKTTLLELHNHVLFFLQCFAIERNLHNTLCKNSTCKKKLYSLLTVKKVKKIIFFQQCISEGELMNDPADSQYSIESIWHQTINILASTLKGEHNFLASRLFFKGTQD
jgi:hypothetical protein